MPPSVHINPGVVGDNSAGPVVGGVTKSQLLRGLKAKKKEKFPPFLIVPGAFFILWILIVNATLYTAERQDTHASIKQQFLGDSQGIRRDTGVQGKRNRAVNGGSGAGGADISFGSHARESAVVSTHFNAREQKTRRRQQL